jgi:hypothetical protein
MKKEALKKWSGKAGKSTQQAVVKLLQSSKAGVPSKTGHITVEHHLNGRQTVTEHATKADAVKHALGVRAAGKSTAFVHDAAVAKKFGLDGRASADR